MQHHQPALQLPAHVSQLPPAEAFSQQQHHHIQQHHQQGVLHNAEIHPVSRSNSNPLPQSMVGSGSASAQVVANFGSQQQSQIPRAVPLQPQQLHQRPNSHHLASPRITMQQQQGRNQTLGYVPSGSGHTASLLVSVSTEASTHPGRGAQITADAPAEGQSTHQPPSSLQVGAKAIQSRVVQVQQDFLSRASSIAGANCSTEAVVRDKAVESVSVVNINDRKVSVAADSDSTSLYVLCRRWIRNDVPRKDQPGLQNFAKLLPKPLPPVKVEIDESTSQDNESKGFGTQSAFEDFIEGQNGNLSEQDLLDTHIKHFKNVRKRSKEQQKQRIERYKLRLSLLLQPSPHQHKVDGSFNF